MHKKYIVDGYNIHIEGEIETLNQYASREVYGFEVIKVETCVNGCEHEEHEHSCGGFFGSDIHTNGITDYLSEEDRNFLKKDLVVT